MNTLDHVTTLFALAGRAAYFGEAVSQTEHALQSARLADAAGAADALVAAALLHDVGHLLHGLGEDAAERGTDDRHERGGSEWLRRHFVAAVAEPVRLHVAAKRYLCAIDPAYLAGLSPASALSLRLQGGPLDGDGRRAFEAEPFFRDAVALRHWDDLAKVPGLDVPGVGHYLPRLRALLLPGAG